ncbi:MAG: hypothetical protein A2168_05300, partial [Planctomycetes bacterium RBG_13_50_24]
TSEKIVTQRLKILDELGMNRFKVSTDPFHQEYVDIEPVRRLAEMAAEILGPDRVLVRWQKYLDNPIDMKNLSPAELEQQYFKAIKDYPCRFTGRAGGKLAEMVADRMPATQRPGGSLKACPERSRRAAGFGDGQPSRNHPQASLEAATRHQAACRSNFLAAKGVHIDPFGNVFSGTCSGIIVGNVNQSPLEDIWKQFDPRSEDLIGTLFNNGPSGLLAEAEELGYEKAESYAGKCHLCTSIRQFMLEHGLYKSTVGPAECYADISLKC